MDTRTGNDFATRHSMILKMEIFFSIFKKFKFKFMAHAETIQW